MQKSFNQLTTQEKLESSIWFKLGWEIGKREWTDAEERSYSFLDNYYRYHENVSSESSGNGTKVKDVLWLNPNFAKEFGVPEKIEIISGAIRYERELFYKDKDGNSVFTKPYEIVDGEPINYDVMPRILSGVFSYRPN